MDLLTQFKQARAKAKEPFVRSPFTVVSALVRLYNLDPGFLANHRNLAIQETEWVFSHAPQAKDTCALPLFSLASAAEYRLIQDILAALGNPYLSYARSPEELLLSRALYRLNPGLEPALLARVHFRTLLAREIARRELLGLDPCPEEEPNNATARRAAFQSLLDRLNSFINLKKQEV